MIFWLHSSFNILLQKMFSINFPDPRTHEFAEWVLFGDYYYHASDIIAFGGEMSVENLRQRLPQRDFSVAHRRTSAAVVLSRTACDSRI